MSNVRNGSCALGLEQMEGRDVPAATVTMQGPVLVITGDDAADMVVVAPGATGQIQVTVNGVAQAPIAATDLQAVVFVGGGGDDMFFNFTNVASVALGGAGNDILVGGSALNVFLGGEGNDVMVGGAGVNVLLGEAGNDVLVSQSSQTVLIGGTGQDAFVGAGAPGVNNDEGEDGESDRMNHGAFVSEVARSDVGKSNHGNGHGNGHGDDDND